MAMTRSYKELKQECADLGLFPVEKGRKSKRPFIKALQKHFLAEKDFISDGLRYRLTMESLMLAKLCTGLKKLEIANIYDSDQWVFEEKHNGVRTLVMNLGDGKEVFSRGLSVTDYLPVCYSDKIFWTSVEPLEHTFVIDCELESTTDQICTVMGNRGVITENKLQAVTAMLALNREDSLRIQEEAGFPLIFKGFDCIYYDGIDLKDRPYRERRQYLKKVIEELVEKGYSFLKSKAIRQNKEEFLEAIFDRGGEGCIAKNINKEYVPTESRPRDGWIKFKRTTTGTLGDTIDAWVSGFELGKIGKGFEGIIGCLYFSTIIRKDGDSEYEHHIAKVVNIPLAMRKKMTITDAEGNRILDPVYYDRVAELEGQAISTRQLRITHARMTNWREDKSKHECWMMEEDLKGMVGL